MARITVDGPSNLGALTLTFSPRRINDPPPPPVLHLTMLSSTILRSSTLQTPEGGQLLQRSAIIELPLIIHTQSAVLSRTIINLLKAFLFRVPRPRPPPFSRSVNDAFKACFSAKHRARDWRYPETATAYSSSDPYNDINRSTFPSSTITTANAKLFVSSGTQGPSLASSDNVAEWQTVIYGLACAATHTCIIDTSAWIGDWALSAH